MTLQADDYIKRGNELFDLRKFQEAYEEFSNAVYSDGSYAEAFERCGDASFEMGKFEDAARDYRRALPLSPSKADLRHKYARTLARAERPDFREVAEAFGEASKCDPHNAEYLFEWGDALFKVEDFAVAAAKLENAVSLKRDYGSAYHLWGRCLSRTGDYAGASEKYAVAARTLPKNKRVFHNWGYALKMLGLYDEAAKKCLAAISLDPEGELHGTHNNLGRIYDKLYMNDEAVAEFEIAAGGAPPVNAYARNNWGNALLRMRRYGEALEKYDEAIALDPDYAKAYNNKAFAYWQQGVYKEALRVWKEACRIFEKEAKTSKDSQDFQLYGDILYSIMHDAGRAAEVYRRALAIQPDDADAMHNLMALYVAEKNEARDAVERNAAQAAAERVYADAERSLAKGARERPDDVDLLLKRAKLRLTIGKYEKAREDYLEALKRLEGKGYYMELAAAYSELGTLCANTDDFRQAAQCFAKALEQNPDDLTTRCHLAEAHCKLGETEKSERAYTEVFSVTPGQVEAYVGRGELYKTMGDAGEADMYDQAVSMYDEAIKLSRSGCGSKVLSNKEMAAVLYARGYARVKLYEATKHAPDERLLRDALADFRLCFSKDRCHLKAKRAQEKLSARLVYTRPQQVFRSYGPHIVFALSLFVFAYTQYLFFTGKPVIWNSKEKVLESLGGEFYSMLTFGSLIFMVAGLSLPQLLKLKIAGVELEKSSVDQIQPSGNIGIKD
jgi:tetratricopeptide (TPR) repeat protein